MGGGKSSGTDVVGNVGAIHCENSLEATPDSNGFMLNSVIGIIVMIFVIMWH